MYCARCNVDFTEGLRYCKWCGQTLEDRRRATGELTACPNCTAPVQPQWTFCKVCGARLTADAGQTAAITCSQCGAALAPGMIHCLKCGENQTHAFSELLADSERPPTSAIANCPTCGERIEPGAIYCKGCGAAFYEQPEIAALICAACKSNNPPGATACRTCGALLIETPASIAEAIPEKPAVNFKRSSTLPDLAEHLPKLEPSERAGDTQERISQSSEVSVESGAQTLILDSTHTEPARAPEPPNAIPRAKGGGQTSSLPGVAGSASERPTPTAALEMERDTGPVSPPTTMSALPPPTANELSPPTVNELPSIADELVTADSVPVTRVTTDNLYSVQETEAEAHEGTFQFVSNADLSAPETNERTVFFGSGSTPPAAFEMGEARPTAIMADEPPPHGRSTPDPYNVAPTTNIGEPRTPLGTAPIAPMMPDATQPLEIMPPPAATPWTTAAPGDAMWTAAAPGDAQGATVPPVAPPHQSDTRFIYLIAALVVMVAAVLAWWFLIGRKPVPSTPPPIATTPPSVESPPTTPPPAETPPEPPTPEGMVMVSAGTYTVGRDNGSDLEKPQRKVALPAFFMDRTEVTNADYKKFVDATHHKPPTNWPGGVFSADHASYPVTGIKWEDADAYAKWAGKRLPTEAEWEAAARGSDGRRYPWGNAWRAGLANIEIKTTKKYGPKDYPDEIKPVGQYPNGASAAGALDMIGNVWEYTADEFKLYPGNPKRLDEITVGPDNLKLKLERGKTYRVFRGGAFDGDQQHDASYRGLIDDSLPYPKIGFRCVKDLK